MHCPELTAPFIGVWYLLGMLIPTAIGAAMGLGPTEFAALKRTLRRLVGNVSTSELASG